MAQSTPRANHSPRWPILWIVLAVLAAAVALAIVGALCGIGTSSSGGATGVRVSGQRDGSGFCPPRGFDVRASRRPGATQVLVPAGASSVRLCRYGATKRQGLLSSRLIRSRPTTRSLAGELNALPQRRGVFACPADIGPRLIAVFGYSAGADDPVTIDLSGCNPVSNGHVIRPAMGRPVIGRIARLVPPPVGAAKTGQRTGEG